ncbi:MAG: molybdopterin-dependent oxidoreductase [Candidatus Sungbacteria bacterium]|uniref:Molybdopterin-dependent oxidoreductase n=1 Tax=Candidatus Sungiibacteriota bacterium TaxID=2750080 RepID=A0A9D6LSA4_9BACT|nr:molybdopterin-dependent oxidoreductase [Candidatus Sungbacteria bacterium]
MADEPQYNEALIKAKEAQAQKHAAVSHDPPAGGESRLPPGQMLTKAFPILDLGIRPSKELYPRWSLELKGNIENPKTLSLDELKQLANQNITADFHCVTRWSRFDLHWQGIPFSKIIQIANPKSDTKFVVFHAFDKYTTNVPYAELLKEKVMVATLLEGEEIPPEHGGPIRMIIPHLYGWKSCKFLTEIQFLTHDQPGFWEERGYSNSARPWKEDRYSDG